MTRIFPGAMSPNGRQNENRSQTLTIGEKFSKERARVFASGLPPFKILAHSTPKITDKFFLGWVGAKAWQNWGRTVVELGLNRGKHHKVFGTVEKLMQ